jgi:hypothetical protein
VQLLTQKYGPSESSWMRKNVRGRTPIISLYYSFYYAIYSLYWYKRTNTDAKVRAQRVRECAGRARTHASDGGGAKAS